MTLRLLLELYYYIMIRAKFKLIWIAARTGARRRIFFYKEDVKNRLTKLSLKDAKRLIIVGVLNSR